MDDNPAGLSGCVGPCRAPAHSAMGTTPGAERRVEGTIGFTVQFAPQHAIISNRLGLPVARTSLGVPRKTRRAYFAKAVGQGVPELKRVERHSHLSVRRRGCDEARIDRADESKADAEMKSITAKLQLL